LRHTEALHRLFAEAFLGLLKPRFGSPKPRFAFSKALLRFSKASLRFSKASLRFFAKVSLLWL
jgi:hypothetical protein